MVSTKALASMAAIEQLIMQFSETAGLESPYAVDISDSTKAFKLAMKQEEQDRMHYYWYRLKRLSKEDREELIKMIIDDEGCSRELADKQVSELLATATPAALLDNLNFVLLECLWDVVKDQSIYIRQQLATMTDADVQRIAVELLADELSAECHDVSDHQQAVDYLKSLRTNPDSLHDQQFFESEFDYFKHLARLNDQYWSD